MGRTPRELLVSSEQNEGSSSGSGGDVVVGLIDKRTEEYVETFRSFSGQGNSLRTTTTTSSSADPSVFDPATLSEPSPVVTGTTTTPIQVRLINGQRRVIRLNLTSTVTDLAASVRHEASGMLFRLVSGFPPQPLDGTLTVEAAGLKGAQVSMQKV